MLKNMIPIDPRKNPSDGPSSSPGPPAGLTSPTVSSGTAAGQPEARPAAGPGPASVRRKRRILFVDTDAARLQLLERMLAGQRRDWDIVFTRACSSATELVGMAPLDAVVLDVNKPGAFTPFLQEAAARWPKVLLFIRCDPAETAAMQKAVGADWRPLPKDCDAEMLIAHVQRAMRLDEWMADEAVRQLIGKMERLPSVPVLYNQVSAELAKPDGSIDFVGKLIARDPAMTVKILQVVNSPIFGLGRQISDPVEAVMYLGVERTKSLILVAGVNLQYDKHRCASFSQEKWWQHSMAVGTFARAVALTETKNAKTADLAFTAGLLHDTGQLLVAANLPDRYSQVIVQAEQRKVSIREVEMETFNTSHAELGACLLGTWGLPVAILEAIGWHHCPAVSGDKKFTLLTAVHVANAVEHEKIAFKSGSRVSQLDTEYIRSLGLINQSNPWREVCGFDGKMLESVLEKTQPGQEAKLN